MNDYTLGMSFSAMLDALLKCDEHIADIFVRYYAKHEHMTLDIINSDKPYFYGNVTYRFSTSKEKYSVLIKSIFEELIISKFNPSKKIGKRGTYEPMYTIPWKDL